MDTLTIHLK